MIATSARTRAELAGLGAPAILFTLALIAFCYTVWLGFQKVQLGGETFIGGANYARMLADPVFWSGLRVSIVL